MFGRLLLAALLAATLASAQGKKGGGSGGNNMDSMTRPARLSKFGMFMDKLKLNKEQQDEAKAAVTAALEESQPVRADLDKSRVAIAGALIDGKSSEEIKKLMDDYSGVAARMTSIEVKAFNRVYASLKPNQQSKAGQAFPLLAEVFDEVGTGGGGGRGGRGRGRERQ